MTSIPLPTRTLELAAPEPRPHVLVVDADSDSRAVLSGMIWPLAHIAEAVSADAALNLAVGHDLAAILIDVDLPGTDAFALVTRLRRHPNLRNVPVLFLSVTAPDWMTERRGYALGALGYLTKPVDAQALRAKLEILITLHHRGAELRRREAMIARQHEEIREARAALEEAAAANRAKDLFLGVLGHDLRNPLSAILMSARLMLMADQLPPKERESILRIARNGERMAALIRDILDYARGQAPGGLPIAPRAANMADICRSMIDEVALLHANRAIQLETSGDLRGEWDRERVEQVISNLLTNALHHGNGNIRIDVVGTADHVGVSIHNGGKPIPPEQLPTLFEPFRRGAHGRSGLGLGLYIVHEILRAHGGRVEVTSSEEAGTTFTTCWPRHAPTRPTGAAP